MKGLFEKRKIWEKIDQKWDHDLHIHTNWSQDNLEGPSMLRWAEMGEKYRIHIGFADHFEMWYYKTKSQKYGTWRLTPDTIDDYLEECDKVREQYPHISTGLEIDFSRKYLSEITNFIDDYRNQFDFLIGSIHRLDTDKEITVKNDFLDLLAQLGNWDRFLEEYFKCETQLIESNLFTGIAHVDVFFRHFEPSAISPAIIKKVQNKIIKLSHHCAQTNTSLEINLSGLLKPWKNSFPSYELFHHLLLDDIPLYIGSDSHTTDYFVKNVIALRKYNRILKNEWLFDAKIDL